MRPNDLWPILFAASCCVGLLACGDLTEYEDDDANQESEDGDEQGGGNTDDNNDGDCVGEIDPAGDCIDGSGGAGGMDDCPAFDDAGNCVAPPNNYRDDNGDGVCDTVEPGDDCVEYDEAGQCVEWGDPGDPNDPAFCEERCHDAFERLIERCGADDVECIDRAHHELAACLEDCGPVEPPPPICVEECNDAFNDRLRECEQLPDPAECLHAIEQDFQRCLEGCGDEPPPPPQCEERCHVQFEEQLRACEETGDPECFNRVHLELDICLGDCFEEPPPQCEDSCFEEFEAWVQSCERDGDPDEDCFRAAEEFLHACLIGCDDEPPPPPECEETCHDRFQERLWTCEENGDPECLEAAHFELEACLANCDDEPPPQCEETCHLRFQDWILECENNGEPDERCFQEAEEFLGACLEDCYDDPPPPPPCEEMCHIRFEEQLRACEETGDPECFEAVHFELDTCLTRCDDNPPPPRCEDGCFEEFEAWVQECEGNGDPNDDCFRAAEEFLHACLTGCDEPPPPPRCEERCHVQFEERLWICEETGDPACFEAVHAELEACLEGCYGDTCEGETLFEASGECNELFCEGDPELNAFIAECQASREVCGADRDIALEITFGDADRGWSLVCGCACGDEPVCPPAPEPDPNECGDEQGVEPIFDDAGCVVGYQCASDPICPPTMLPVCEPGEEVRRTFDEVGCVYFECVATGDGFACGDDACALGEEYCQVTYPGLPGASIDYACQALPDSCVGQPSCDCLSSELFDGQFGPYECVERDDGEVELQLYLP